MSAIQIDLQDDPPFVQRAHRPILSILILAICFLIAGYNPNIRHTWNSVETIEISRMTTRLEQGTVFRQVGFLAVGLWGALTLLLRRSSRSIRPTTPVLFCAAVYVLWAFLSIAWSPDRSLTAKRLIIFACTASAIYAFARNFKPRDLVMLAFISSSALLAAGIFVEVLYPIESPSHFAYRFSGMLHPNHTGIYSWMVILTSLYFFDRTRIRLFIVWACVAALVLLLTKSRTALLAGIFGLGMYFTLRWPIRRTLWVGFGLIFTNLAMVALSLAGLMPPVWSALLLGRSDSDVTTLTGRSDIWAAAFEWFGYDSTRLLTGFGYQSFWTSHVAEFVSMRVMFHISEGHNAYLDTLFTLGVVGLVCYATMLFVSLLNWTRAAHQRHNASFAVMAAFLTFALVHGLAESTFVDPNLATFFTFCAMMMCAIYNPLRRTRDEELE